MKKVLIPVKDTRKSFYGKALTENHKLYSYDTLVCEIKDNKIILNRSVDEDLLFSATALRHIKEFIYQELGLELTKKDLLKTME